MKTPFHHLPALARIGALFVLLASSLAARTWTSADGSATFEGELKAYNPDTGALTVTRADGRDLTFNQDKLSADDIAFLKENGAVAPPAAAGSSRPSSSGGVKELPDVLPDPDGEEADMSKPVQVFILMGQSNMLGFGKTANLEGIAADKYPYLLDDGLNWTVRKDVRNVFFCMGGLRHNDWLTAENGNGSGKFGPEIGIGNYLGYAIDAPVLILKSCVGNRALGWDLLPPSADGTGAKGQSYQGDSEYGNRQVSEEVKAANGWYAGLQYDQDVGAAQKALKDLSTYYPDATDYEVAGFFWWQGCSEGKGSVENYDKNLAYLFSDLKKDFNAPNAKFVCATLGEHDKDATLSKKMFSFADADKDAEVFFSKPVSKGGSCGHYGGDPETYMNVGEGMGRLMVELLQKN
ncbi:sialate O-acetylesterase [Haloferula sp. A504]|uniref:sialate O-acetylesterase n=1 Tax=Haloferula sp. A504 TaxID=3373601 RepID=UPI0031BDAFC9|nr:sialate O-acetylesterase [Verrucomicrobiaceae bacterium E54]